MARGEFEIIEHFFRSAGSKRRDVLLGIGDDAAIVSVPPGFDLVAATDTLVAGRHFPEGSPAESIGHRALAVNLSDMAAMGAHPAWALLALTIPSADEAWLGGFVAGFSALAQRHSVALIGGDTTAGPLTVTVQVLGVLPKGQGLRRSGGQPGDALYITGTPGDSAAGLLLEQGKLATLDRATGEWLRQRFLMPTPRVAIGERLRGVATSCIDISDGLHGDIGKLVAASGCAARIAVESLPISAALTKLVGRERAQQLALTGGEDFELCFTLPAAAAHAVTELLPEHLGPVTRIGTLMPGANVTLLRNGRVVEFEHGGYDHFAS